MAKFLAGMYQGAEFDYVLPQSAREVSPTLKNGSRVTRVTGTNPP